MVSFSLWGMLPGLPSSLPLPLPLPSFPQSLQRRLLAFLVTKAVGPFLKGRLDPHVVEADLARGEVRIGRLELDGTAINPLLLSVPGLAFEHGTLASIAATVASPLSFKSPVALELADIDLVLRLDPHSATPPRDPHPHPHPHPSADLADSVLSVAVAESFVREELHAEHEHEEQHESIPHLALPGAFSQPPTGAELATGEPKDVEVTVIAAIIERLLARLSVRVDKVRVRVRLPDGAVLELRVAGVECSQVSSGANGDAIRDVTLAGFEILFAALPSPAAIAHPSREPSSGESTTDSDSSDDLSPEQHMYMSQSIADLRTSTASFVDSAATSSALYASAYGGLDAISEAGSSEAGDTADDESSPFFDPEPDLSAPTLESKWHRVSPLSAPPSPPPPRPASPQSATPTTEPERHRLISLGPAPVLIRLSSTRSSLAVSCAHAGPVLVLLDPSTLASLLALAASLPSSPSLPPSPPPLPAKSAPALSLDLALASLSLIVQTTSVSVPDALWTQPHPPSLPPHLRLRIDGFSFTQDLKSGVRLANVRDLAVVDCTLASKPGLPIIVADPSLGAEKFNKTARKGLGEEEIEIVDWVREGGDWRGKARRGKGKDEDAAGLRIEDGSTTLTLHPLHIFLDLSLLDRLSPLLALLTTTSPTAPSTSTTPTTTTPRPRSPRGVLDDLAPEPTPTPTRTRVRCPLVRVEVRCPAPGSSIEAPTRSGIFVVDLRQFRLGKVDGAELVVTCERTCAYFVPSQSTRATAFVALSALPSSPSEASLPPTLALLPSVLEAQIPLVRISLDKRTFDGLELFVDDLGQWTERRALSQVDDEPPARIVGSRYFATTIGRDASESWQASESGRSERSVRVAVMDLVVDLFVGSEDCQRHLKGSVSDVDLKVDLLRNSKDNMSIEAIIMDILFEDVTVSSEPITILARTLPRNLATGSIPIVKVGITSAGEQETGLKESKIKVLVANFTYYLSSDLGWLSDVALFAQAPAGAFETVVPNELTRLRLRIADCSIQVTPPTLGSRLIVNLEDATVSANLMPDMPRMVVATEVRGLRVLAVESEADLRESEVGAESGWTYWKAMGFVEIVDVQRSVVQVRQGNGLVLPDFELVVSETKVVVTICADSASALSALASDFSAALESKSKSAPKSVPQPSRRLPTRKRSLDLLASVDPAAFGHAPQFNDMPEYLDDDVPTNVDYLADALKQSAPTPSRTVRRPVGDGLVISDIEGETIKMLDPAGLRVLDGFLAEPREDPDGDSEGQAPSVVRCRLSSTDVTIHIHEGYDWASTRKAIEAEAKVVRLRLAKIKQLLERGQKADASAADASVLMFGSVQLGLPPGASELPAPDLLAAIDVELAEPTNDDDASSWQSLENQPAARKPTRVGKARRRLTRSPAFAIEVNLRGVGATFDTYPLKSQLASRVRVDVETFEIIDNIRTSTWRKFLTELRASDGGVVRASESSMVRFELNKVRPVGRAADSPEIVMKIKIVPLRLYIDQDALDFLKAFGAFKAPASTGVAGVESDVPAGLEPFFQRVEILPVKIKLDYKPKRVDYHALRQGKVAELMNFFHFDGSEMTLRHLVVTGVSGSTRLSDLVQDIWTPDVKANQLADVISGIAPVRSVVNLGSGVANLVLLPIEQYRKDGRLARGLQRGASSFARTTTLEALNVGARLATGTQVILEQAESVLGARSNATVTAEAASNGSPILLSDEEHSDLISRYAEQPADLREGFGSAYRSLGDNFRSAAQTILAVPMEVYERSGTEGPVRAVVRAVPIAVLKPMIGASEAVSKALFGLRNSLDPDAQAEAADKYKARAAPS